MFRKFHELWLLVAYICALQCLVQTPPHPLFAWNAFMEMISSVGNFEQSNKIACFFICRELVKYLIMYVISKRCIKFNFCKTWKSNKCMKEYDSYLIGHIALWSLMWWGLVRRSLWLRRLKVKRPCMCEKRHHLSTLTFLKEATDNSSVWKKLPYYKIIIKWLLWFNQLQQKNFVGMNQGSIKENYISIIYR